MLARPPHDRRLPAAATRDGEIAARPRIPAGLMCFSPEADVVAAVVIGAVGVATLRRVRTRRELIVGALPLLFAAHQFTESFVWLGLRGQVPAGVAAAARDVYITYAFAVLPIIVPLGFLLLETSARHRRWLRPFVVLGSGIGLLLLWGLATHPVEAVAHARGIAYEVHIPYLYPLACGYVVATCVPALLSSRFYLRWFGAMNLVAAAVATSIHRADFASVWCMYAAVASVLILEHFRRERAAPAVRSTPARAGDPCPSLGS